MYGCSISELHDGAQLYTYILGRPKTFEYFHRISSGAKSRRIDI